MTSLPRSLEDLDYAALEQIEAKIRTLKANLYQQAETKARTMLDKVGATLGVKWVPTQVTMPATNGNGQHKAAPKVVSGRKAHKAIKIKYRDPSNPENTWSGRGRPARWLAALEKQGHKRIEFAIR